MPNLNNKKSQGVVKTTKPPQKVAGMLDKRVLGEAKNTGLKPINKGKGQTEKSSKGFKNNGIAFR